MRSEDLFSTSKQNIDIKSAKCKIYCTLHFFLGKVELNQKQVLTPHVLIIYLFIYYLNINK